MMPLDTFDIVGSTLYMRHVWPTPKSALSDIKDSNLKRVDGDINRLFTQQLVQVKVFL